LPPVQATAIMAPERLSAVPVMDTETSNQRP